MTSQIIVPEKVKSSSNRSDVCECTIDIVRTTLVDQSTDNTTVETCLTNGVSSAHTSENEEHTRLYCLPEDEISDDDSDVMEDRVGRSKLISFV